MSKISERHKHEEGSCCCQPARGAVTQNLSELDFERGIWNAVINNETERVREFVRKGQINAKDNSGYTALHYAARSGSIEICNLLISSGADVNAVTNGGASPLHRAAMMGHIKIVSLLLSNGANSILQDSDGQTALHRSSIKGSFEICHILLKKSPQLKTIKDNKQLIPYELIKIDDEKLRKLLQDQNV